VGLLSILPGQMCDDVLRAFKQIVLDNELAYFADWGNLVKENFPCAMNDSRFLPEIRNLLRALDDWTLDAELHDLYANTLSQLISLRVEQSFTRQSFTDPTPPKPQSKEAALSSSESLSSWRHLFQSITCPISFQTNLNSKTTNLCMNGLQRCWELAGTSKC
jgi:hypothetical protein